MKFDVNEITKLITGKLESWYEISVKMLPNIALAVVVIVIFYIVSKIAKKLISKILPKITQSTAILGLTKTIISMIILSIGLFIALGILNLDKTVTSILAGAGVIGLALGFAFQEIATNFVSGILIAITQPYHVGDIIEVDDEVGEVSRINLRTTSVITFSGIEVFIPNKKLFTETLKNYTTTPYRRIDLTVGVSYSDDLDVAEKVARDVAKTLPDRLKSKPIQIYYSAFNDSSIDLIIRVWIKYPGDDSYLKMRHKLIKDIKKGFDNNKISIPFPIRTIDLPDNFYQSNAQTQKKGEGTNG